MLHTFLLPVLAAAAGATLIMLAWNGHNAGQRRRTARAGYFDACRSLFGSATTALAATGFARLNGRYRGHLFDLQAVPDTLSYRKLPVLWLLVTLPEPQPVRGTFDLMLRPGGLEVFSKFSDLPMQLTLPAGFPDCATLRTDDASALPSEPLLRRHLSLFGHDHAKELVIAPAGLRITWLAEQADRGRYLIFRDAEMGMTALSPETLRPLLDRLIALLGDLAAEARVPQTAR